MKKAALKIWKSVWPRLIRIAAAYVLAMQVVR